MGPSAQTSPRATVPVRAPVSKCEDRVAEQSRSSVFALRAETRDDRGLLLLLNPPISPAASCITPPGPAADSDKQQQQKKK
ncbi:hypothetical protein PBY51_023169 [Eleginops maclovinus]|uniref:Uncharacterized protein n=1 Tax=Eleginops maclovinus TaxID=56733 RepID=A0AAN7X1Q3_ELEMC|nr:hypothetical protein PBY51_023169 [Eleginops maclovinus]